MMRRLIAIAASTLLAGCLGPGALLLSAAAHEKETGYVHPPNAGDYASWVGEPKIQLETHAQFSQMPRAVRPLSDGSEMWTLRFCRDRKARVSADECCLFEFVIRDTKVASYQTIGACGVDCSLRPDAKVQACVNGAIVPDGYGAHDTRRAAAR